MPAIVRKLKRIFRPPFLVRTRKRIWEKVEPHLPLAPSSRFRMRSRPLPPPHVPDDIHRHRILIVAAHPDDETIGAAGLLQRCRDASVVIVTDGVIRDAAAARGEGFPTMRDYARARRQETAKAIALLPRPLRYSINLGYPDSEAIFCAASVARRLASEMQRGQFEYVVTHAYEGGHTDHDAVALSVHCAALLIAGSGARPPHIVEMGSYWFDAGRMVCDRFREVAGAGPAMTMKLDEAEREIKRRMFACYGSQAGILAEFRDDVERFRVAPNYDFLKPAAPGLDSYRTRFCTVAIDVWLRAAQRALHRLNLLEHVGTAN